MNNDLFLGIDVGGTKISSALVTERGKIISREKIPTPLDATSRIILKTIKSLNNYGEMAAFLLTNTFYTCGSPFLTSPACRQAGS